MKLLGECSSWPWWKVDSLDLEIDVFNETRAFALQFSNYLIPIELRFTSTGQEVCNTGDNHAEIYHFFWVFEISPLILLGVGVGGEGEEAFFFFPWDSSLTPPTTRFQGPTQCLPIIFLVNTCTPASTPTYICSRIPTSYHKQMHSLK